MLTKDQIKESAKFYLLEHDFKIVKESGRVTFSNKANGVASKEFLAENNLASVSFASIYCDHPAHSMHELDPGVYIVYVNISTGEVHMPRHM